MIIGERYGKLTVVSIDGPKATCLCDCGNEAIITSKNLLNGHTKSCGCLKKNTRINVNRAIDLTC